MPLTTSTWHWSSKHRMFSLSCQAGRFLLCSSIDLKRRDDCVGGKKKNSGKRWQKKEETRGVRGHHGDAFSRGDGPKTLTHLLLGKLSAQLAVFLQHVVHLGAVLAHRPLPQIDVAFALNWDGGGPVLFIPVGLLRLSRLLNFKRIWCYVSVKICTAVDSNDN